MEYHDFTLLITQSKQNNNNNKHNNNNNLNKCLIVFNQSCSRAGPDSNLETGLNQSCFSDNKERVM
jgi:hypothetical protein